MTPSPSEERNWSQKGPAPRGGARGGARGPLPPKILPGPPSGPPKIRYLSVGLFLKVLHRPLTAPLVAKLAPPVAPQMKMSVSAPACTACTCGERSKHFIDDMNFETRQRCGTCPPSKQDKTRFTCQLPTMGSTCLH